MSGKALVVIRLSLSGIEKDRQATLYMIENITDRSYAKKF